MVGLFLRVSDWNVPPQINSLNRKKNMKRKVMVYLKAEFVPRAVNVDLWWTKWHRDRLFSKSFGFNLSASLHCCSILTHASTGGSTMGPLGVAILQRHNLIPSPDCFFISISASNCFTSYSYSQRNSPINAHVALCTSVPISILGEKSQEDLGFGRMAKFNFWFHLKYSLFRTGLNETLLKLEARVNWWYKFYEPIGQQNTWKRILTFRYKKCNN